MKNKNILTMKAEAVKKERFLLECMGLIENKALFQLDNALQSIKTRKAEKIYINQYTIGV